MDGAGRRNRHRLGVGVAGVEVLRNPGRNDQASWHFARVSEYPNPAPPAPVADTYRAAARLARGVHRGSRQYDLAAEEIDNSADRTGYRMATTAVQAAGAAPIDDHLAARPGCAAGRNHGRGRVVIDG